MRAFGNGETHGSLPAHNIYLISQRVNRETFMPTIAKSLKEIMTERNKKRVWAGDPNLCLDAYERSGGTRVHPLNRIKSVIDAARKSPDFESVGYIRAHDAKGSREILHPVFRVREEKDELSPL